MKWCVLRIKTGNLLYRLSQGVARVTNLSQPLCESCRNFFNSAVRYRAKEKGDFLISNYDWTISLYKTEVRLKRNYDRILNIFVKVSARVIADWFVTLHCFPISTKGIYKSLQNLIQKLSYFEGKLITEFRSIRKFKNRGIEATKLEKTEFHFWT